MAKKWKEKAARQMKMSTTENKDVSANKGEPTEQVKQPMPQVQKGAVPVMTTDNTPGLVPVADVGKK
jgi:hypothetical protein